MDPQSSDDSSELLVPEVLKTELARLFDQAPPIPPDRQEAIVGAAVQRFRKRGQIQRLARRVAPALMPVLRHWRPGIGGLAAAAVIVFAVVTFFQRTQTARADDALCRRVALQLMFLPIADPFISDDPSALAARLDEIDQLKAERDRFLRLAADAPDEKARNQANSTAMQPWHGVYRRLRDLVRFDDAIREALSLVEYIRSDANLRNPHGPLKSALADLGNIYLAMSDFANARAAYAASISERQEYVRVTRLIPPDHPDNVGNPIQTLVPLYWSMNNVAIAEGTLAEAREWMNRADEAFRVYFTGICLSNGIDLTAETDAVTALRATPHFFRFPPENPTEEQTAGFAATYRGWKPNAVFVTKLRAHLYYKARLALAEGDTRRAQQELDAGRTVAYYACHDEDRLDFNEPLVAARIAIAEKLYQDASAHISEAEQHSGLPACSDLANRRPISTARLAELTFLKAVARLGHNPADEEGERLLERGLKVVDALAAEIPEPTRAAFVKQFDALKTLADGVRRNRR